MPPHHTHACEALMNQITALTKEILQSSFTPSAMQGHRRHHLQMSKQALKHQIYQHLDLEFPSLNCEKQISVIYKAPNV